MLPPARIEANQASIISTVLPDGGLVECVFDADAGVTRLIHARDGLVETVEKVTHGGEELTPYSPHNSLLKHRVILLPSQLEEYGDADTLTRSIEAYIHRYVDLSPDFEQLATQYVIFSWLYDRFNELPYLRLQGEYGTGKTRFLLVVGSICRTPIFASGASTVSPIFHMLNRFGGTLLLDEADFRFSDEKAQISKVLNNGNVRGFPVLRSESQNGREFSPRAYQVFGPKIIGMRGEFEDRALESRFISERTEPRALRADIPINLPDEQAREALSLRNQLLAYRFHNYHRVGALTETVDASLEPRINQVFAPLLSVMTNDRAKHALRAIARNHQEATMRERSATAEAHLLTVLLHLLRKGERTAFAVGTITLLYRRAFGHDASHRWVGHVLRKKLRLSTVKRHGVFVVPFTDLPRLEALFERYGVTAEDADAIALAQPAEIRVDFGDIGEFGGAAPPIADIEF